MDDRHFGFKRNFLKETLASWEWMNGSLNFFFQFFNLCRQPKGGEDSNGSCSKAPYTSDIGTGWEVSIVYWWLCWLESMIVLTKFPKFSSYPLLSDLWGCCFFSYTIIHGSSIGILIQVGATGKTNKEKERISIMKLNFLSSECHDNWQTCSSVTWASIVWIRLWSGLGRFQRSEYVMGNGGSMMDNRVLLLITCWSKNPLCRSWYVHSSHFYPYIFWIICHSANSLGLLEPLVFFGALKKLTFFQEK